MKEFNQVYKEYYKPLYGFLLRLTDYNEPLAEELTQESFYQAFLSLHRYNGKCEFFTWLCQIGKHTYFKYLSKHKEVPLDFSRLEEELGQEKNPSAEQVCESQIMIRDLQKAIGKLKKQQREVVLLRIYADLSFREIGQLLNIKENAAKIRFHRAKERLKQLLS